jgi:hypothetical protein
MALAKKMRALAKKMRASAKKMRASAKKMRASAKKTKIYTKNSSFECTSDWSKPISNIKCLAIIWILNAELQANLNRPVR